MEPRIRGLRPSFDLTFWQKIFYKKLEELRLSEEAIPVRGKIKPGSQKEKSEFTEIEFDCFSFDQKETSISKNSYYSVEMQGVLKIFNMKEDYLKFMQENPKKSSFSILEKLDPQFWGTTNQKLEETEKDKKDLKPSKDELEKKSEIDPEKKLRESAYFFFIPVFINLKTFQLFYSFFEIKYCVNYLDLMISSSDHLKEKKLEADVIYSELTVPNSLCLNPSKSLFYDPNSSINSYSWHLVTYMLDEFYGSQMATQISEDFKTKIYVVKSPLVLNYLKNDFVFGPVKRAKKKLSLKELAGPTKKIFSVGLFDMTFPKDKPEKEIINVYGWPYLQ